MKWFKHFTDAHDNNDLTKVRVRYGADGYAVYWYCLELIAGELGFSDAITFELHHDAEVIGHNLKIDTGRVEEIMNHMILLGLFERANNVITCLKLAKYLDKKSTRNKEIHRIIDTASELSGTNPDSPGQSRTLPDKAGLSPLDVEVDVDIEKAKPYVGFAPDASVASKKKPPAHQEMARDVLAFLNQKTGRRYQPVRANLDVIVARLKEGATVIQLRQVIVRKTREWQGDEKMNIYLRPATLFNRTKFWQYAGELVPEVEP